MSSDRKKTAIEVFPPHSDAVCGSNIDVCGGRGQSEGVKRLLVVNVALDRSIIALDRLLHNNRWEFRFALAVMATIGMTLAIGQAGSTAFGMAMVEAWTAARG